MKTEIITITPEMAKQMLGRNENNRPINWKRVDVYANDMKRGEWKLNGESIIMNGTRLLNGQKRLWACVKSGVSFTTVVVEGVDNDAFDTMDQNEVRGKDQILHIAGVPSARRVVSAIQWYKILADATGKKSVGASRQLVQTTAAQLLKFTEDHASALESVNKTYAAYKRFQCIVPGPFSGLVLFLMFRNEPLIDEFVDGVSSGAGLEDGDPRLALRNRLIDRSAKRDKEKIEHVAFLYVYAWNAFKEGRKISRLSLKGNGTEKLPVIA